MNPQVSVIVPSFNHEAYIGAAIRSVLAQSLDAFELVIVDDASIDTSWSIIEGFDDPRIRTLRHQSNCGAHATLNEALAMACGEYVAILNSDDIFHPRRLEALLDAARAADAGLAFSDLEFIDDDGQPIADHPRTLEHQRTRQWCGGQPASTWFLAGNLAVTTSNFLFRRQLLDELGGFLPLRYTHDWAWALTVAAHQPLCWVREPLLRYRVHAANTLSEGDRWRHVHENAFIQSLALGRLARIRATQAPQGDDIDAISAALLRNLSGPPLTHMAFLLRQLAGASDEALLALARRDGDQWLAPTLAHQTGLPEGVFMSLGELVKQSEQVDTQAAMLEQRWQAMQEISALVDQRDEVIASQKAMIDERWTTIKEMESEIRRRDQILAMNDEMIAARNEANAAQARMLEERYEAIQEMGRTIFEREEALAAAQQALDRVSAELERLRAHPMVRAALAAKRLFKSGGA